MRAPGGGVQECVHHGRQPVAALGHPEVGGTRKHGELGARQADHVAGHTAAEEPEHRDGVLGAHDVGVADDDQGRGFDRSDDLGGATRAEPETADISITMIR